MRTDPMIYAAECEQAAAALHVENNALDTGVSGRTALEQVVDRYGIDGQDLIFEYQNDLDAVVGFRRRPRYALFH